MKVSVRFFASLRESLGGSTEADVPIGSTVGQLRAELAARGPSWAEALATQRAVRASVDQVMGDEYSPLREGAEVAFFPPVTGG